MIYIGYVAPFVFKWMNRLELANEFIVLVSTYFLFIYSEAFVLKDEPLLAIGDLVKDYDVQYEVGWYHIGVLGALVALNMTVMLTVQFAQLFRKIKLYYLKRKQRKRIELYILSRKQLSGGQQLI